MSDIRLRTLEIEEKTLSENAFLCKNTKGRLTPEGECPVRTAFQRDRDRIIHCKAFRRLKNKTQVFVAPEGDHYITRLTHTLDVSQIARSIARTLCLNEDLTEAIALGHDLGHTPFGHSGERALDEICDGGFRHYEQSLRVIDFLENENMSLHTTFKIGGNADVFVTPETKQVFRLRRLKDESSLSLSYIFSLFGDMWEMASARVVIVDTSNEIAGDGDTPHPAIGAARRMQVPQPEYQKDIMIEAVENYTLLHFYHQLKQKYY